MNRFALFLVFSFLTPPLSAEARSIRVGSSNIYITYRGRVIDQHRVDPPDEKDICKIGEDLTPHKVIKCQRGVINSRGAEWTEKRNFCEKYNKIVTGPCQDFVVLEVEPHINNRQRRTPEIDVSPIFEALLDRVVEKIKN